MTPKMVEDFYVKKKAKFMKSFEERLASVKEELIKKYDNSKSEDLISQMKEEFEKILPDIPYIGGQKNPTTLVLVKCMSDLAVFRVLENVGLNFDEIGEIHYRYVLRTHKIRKEILENGGREPSEYPFDPVYVDYQRKLTEDTQLKLYPDDWVMDFVKGDDKDFEWGWDIYECGVQKAYKKVGGEKYLPLICLGDFYEAEGLGFGFTRTETLGFGAEKCTHRFTRTIKTPKAWPPFDLKEFNSDYWDI
ncbi:MAG: L-2-amino-thiazoline-4-carboxylic acid hydrolase [Candidatus Hermodarchaeota archaeon]